MNATQANQVTAKQVFVTPEKGLFKGVKIAVPAVGVHDARHVVYGSSETVRAEVLDHIPMWAVGANRPVISVRIGELCRVMLYSHGTVWEGAIWNDRAGRFDGQGWTVEFI